MKNSMLLIGSLWCFVLTPLASGATIWREDFAGQEGKGVEGPGTTYNTNGITTWTIDASACLLANAGDYAAVVAAEFVTCDTGGEAVWRSEIINILGYTNVGITIALSEEGNLQNDEYVRCYYKLDGGPETEFETNGDMTDDFGSATASQSDLYGSTLVIVVRTKSDVNTHLIKFDDVTVSGVSLLPTVQFSTAAGTTVENAGPTNVAILISFPASATVQVAVAGSAVYGAGNDYTNSTTNIVFSAGGPARQTFTVFVLDDLFYETNETVVLALQNPDGAVLGSVDTYTLEIRDDDAIRLQGFEADVIDDWDYVPTPGTGTIAISTERWYSGEKSLKLTGSNRDNADPYVTFANVNVNGYSNVVLSISYAADGPDNQDDLEVWLAINGIDSQAGYVAGFDNSDFDFGGIPHDDGSSITDNPYTYAVPEYAETVGLVLLFDERGNTDNRNDHWYVDDIVLTGLPAPEISVLGTNAAVIRHGDTTPDSTNGTDYGTVEASAGMQNRTFTITNSGLLELNLTTVPAVQLSGDTNDFAVLLQPAVSNIAAASSTAFTVQFDPTVLGVHTVLVSIANNDISENPYRFVLQGTGRLAAEPTVQGSNLVFTAVAQTQMTILWDNGNGSNRILVAKEGSAVGGVPTDGTVYNADTVFADGDTIAAGAYVVYNGNGTTVTVTGLLPNRTYYFALFEYNGTQAGLNYLVSNPPTGSQVTTTFAPAITEGESTTVTMSENGNPTAFSLTLNAADGDLPYGDTLTWSIRNVPEHGTAGASGTGTSKAIGYTPLVYYSGGDSFVVQVTDSFGNFDTITVHVTISAVNAPGKPVFIFE